MYVSAFLFKISTFNHVLTYIILQQILPFLDVQGLQAQILSMHIHSVKYRTTKEYNNQTWGRTTTLATPHTNTIDMDKLEHTTTDTE